MCWVEDEGKLKFVQGRIKMLINSIEENPS
jgi:hypothetical protein